MSGKKKHKTANEYLQYLKGDLTGQERHSFERDLEANAFEKEALEGLEMLTPDQAEKDMLTLHSRMRKRLSRKRRVTWYRIAASIASLLIIGTVFLQIYDLNPGKTEDPMIEEGLLLNRQPEPPQEPVEKEAMVPEQKGAETETTEAEVVDVPAAEAQAAEAQVAEAQAAEVQVTEAQAAKAQAAEAQVAEAQVAEAQVAKAQAANHPEPITLVEAEAAPRKQAETFDHMVSEAAPVGEELPEDQSSQRARKRSEKMDQPTAAQPAEMPKRVLFQDAYEATDHRDVSGVILSGEDMRPLPGASVTMKGSNQGVITNKEGMFSIPLQDNSEGTIVASFVGMESQEYRLQGNSDIQLVLQPDPSTLDEVVVLGQGLQPVHLQNDARQSLKAGGGSSQETTPAQPSGGIDAFKTYVEENIRFPESETTTDRAVVILLFTVTSNGQIREVIPLYTPGNLFTEEAIRLLKEGPAWIPATSDNVSVDEIVRLRLLFKH